MKTLREMYEEHQGKVADKWSLYLGEWERLFAPYRHLPIRLLEIGMQNGGSLEIYGKYFSKAEQIVGCDIDPKCKELLYEDDRIAVVIGDANDISCVNEVSRQSRVFDIVIDDGSHKSSDIVRSFAHYFPKLSEGGIYVVEDLHASYWKIYEGGTHAPLSSISFFKRLADVVNFEHWRNNTSRTDLLGAFSEDYRIDFEELDLAKVHSVEFINSLCIIKKLRPEENILGPRIIVGSDEPVVSGCKALHGTIIQDFQVDIGDNSNPDGFDLAAPLAERAAAKRDVDKLVKLGKTEQVLGIDRALIKRLVAAFNRSNEAYCYGIGSQWLGIRRMHDGLASAVKRGDIYALAAALQRPDLSDIFYGFEDLGRWSVQAYCNADRREEYAQHCYAVLQRLAQAIGVLRMPNPEAIDRHPEVPPPSELATAVEQTLGFAICPPSPYPNYYGLDTALGILGEHVLNALYCVHRVKQLTRGIDRPRVLEIGPGLGRLAHYAFLAGITDYWLVDVPFTGLSHGHFLATALGSDRVVLDGEPESPSPDRIKFLSVERFFREPLPSFDLVVNVDSLTALGKPLAEKYFTHLAPRCRMFLSVNHEANEFSVSDIQRRTCVFALSQRHPYWVRRGYVEELFWHDLA